LRRQTLNYYATFGEARLFNFDDIDSNQSVFVVVVIGWMVVNSERMQIQ
jgi:hypothetical protein